MTPLLDLKADEYHADATGDPRPALSASLIHTICTKSALHAWHDHPKLNPNFVRVEQEKFDLGNAAHALLLEGRSTTIVVIDAPDWRTKAAKEARDAARAAGLVPMLETQYQEATEMVAAVRKQIAALPAVPALFTDGTPEQTVTWDDGGVLCKARIDWLHDDLTAIDDFKTTGKSAHPEAYSRALYAVGGDIQAAFYLRGLTSWLTCGDLPSTPIRPAFRWIVVECQPPFALSVIQPGDDVLELANRKIDYALDVWRQCLETDTWPAYPARIATAELPAWEESRWLEREVFEEAAAA